MKPVQEIKIAIQKLETAAEYDLTMYNHYVSEIARILVDQNETLADDLSSYLTMHLHDKIVTENEKEIA